MGDKLLEVKNLTIGFPEENGMHTVVDNVSFTLRSGEIIGIVGESGSGKSMTVQTIMGLEKPEATIQSGEILFNGKDLLKMSDEDLAQIQGNDMSMVFQEPMTSLNPVKKIGWQVGESLKIHSSMPDEEIHRRTVEILANVGLPKPEELCEKYPHQLSGGMRQRVMIAMAMICWPKLLIADEPTTALDVTVQAQILQLLRKIHAEANTSILFISHDLNVVKEICQKVIVMYQGKIVETGYTEDVLYHPKHDYTKHLIAAIPRNLEDTREDEIVMKAENLNAYYSVKARGMFGKKENKHVLQNVDFYIKRGEILGLVGESGCGKSTLAKCIVGLNKNYTGTLDIREKHPQLIFQDPYSSLNPMKKIGWILEEPLKVHGVGDKAKRKAMVEQMLEQVGLDASYADRYPSELSGGQRQRISIGGALILNSKFIVADEPVSALDVTVQSQVLNLLLDLHRTHQLTYLFISHDLNIVRHFCNRVIVMYLGEIVEEAEVDEIYEDPKHPYTQLLFHSILTDERKQQKITDVEQSREDASGEGCPFYQRCTARSSVCNTKRPERINIGADEEHPHWVKCFKYQ
ncbi:MAG: ABC transporter ATP-binding protein [Clostridia bacterium]|nr:ABC transporter ATP-binding protein [Lachnospiraceae bacterium]NCB99880.1 ABC transporter ATP-binding protein [Clostridia bacterium]NCD02819.1 ABC transporter ATP-binding protein [Clostridia bacterium]